MLDLVTFNHFLVILQSSTPAPFLILVMLEVFFLGGVNWEFSRPSALIWSTCFFLLLKKVLIFPQFIIKTVLQSPSWQVAARGCCTKNLIVIIILSGLFVICMKDTTFTSTLVSLDLLFVLNFSVSLPLGKCLQTSLQTTNLTVATW